MLYHAERYSLIFFYMSFIPALLCISGCAVGPDYIRPEIKIPETWHQQQGQDMKPGSAGGYAWWEQLNDTLLNDLMRQAMEKNHDLKIAFDRINESRAMLGVASGRRFPELDAQGSAIRSRLSEDYIVPSFDGRRTDYNYGAGFDVLWELDLWGRISRMIQSAGAGLDASVEAWRGVMVVLQSEVAFAYVELRTLQARLHYARANADIQLKTMNLAQDRFKAEIAPELDTQQASLNLALTRSVIPLFEMRIEQMMNRLGVLTGMHAGSLHAGLAQPLPIPQSAQPLPVCLPADMLRQRPDVRRAERELAAQAARIGVATADLYPSFTLGGTFGFVATMDLLDAAHRSWSFGPQLRWNLFNGLRTRSLIQAEEARTRQALNSYEQTVLSAVEEVENALAAYVYEKERNEFLEQTVQSAQKSVELVRSMYLNGLTDFQNLHDMEKMLFQQQDRLAESQGLITQHRIAVYKALGAGWVHNGNKPVVVSDSHEEELR